MRNEEIKHNFQIVWFLNKQKNITINSKTAQFRVHHHAVYAI